MAQERRSKRAAAVRDDGSSAGSPFRYRKAVNVVALLAAMGIGAALGPFARPRKSHALPHRAERAAQNTRLLEGRIGPWGRLEYSPIAISIPDDYVLGDPPSEPVRWWFAGLSRDSVDALFRDAGLTAEQLRLLAGARWEVSPKGVIVDPPGAVVAGLSTAARTRIYEALSQTERNEEQFTPEIFYPEYMDERLESSGLGDEPIALVRKLLYPRKSWMLFSDSPVVLATLQTENERRRFQQMIHRKRTFVVQLVVERSADIDAMMAYWDFPGRSKGLRPLLESLARVPGGGELDIAHLLPPFARKRLYTYPDDSADAIVRSRECSWTALNFFNDPPDDRFANPAYTRTVVDDAYETVTSPRFGDLVVLTDPENVAHHFAVYLADDLTFTKNGFSKGQPWMLMKVADLVDQYSISLPAPLEVSYHRRKR